jgi:Tol biopolymer transport system component
VVAAADLGSEINLTDSLQYRKKGSWQYSFGCPAWSPDGSMVAFWAQEKTDNIRVSYTQLWIAAADGNQLTMIREFLNSGPYLPQNGIGGALNWSPTGELVYEAYSGSGILVAVDIATGELSELLDGGPSYQYPVSQPSLSPDLDPAPGYQGMIAMTFGFGDDIYTAPISSDPDTGVLLPIDPSLIQNVTNSPTMIEAHPSWSPDGSAIACYQDDGIAEWLAVIDTSTELLAPIYPDFYTQGSGHDRPTWTSDGLDLIYRTQESGIDTNDLSIIAADGIGLPANYTNTGSRDEKGPAWNPNWDPSGPGGF